MANRQRGEIPLTIKDKEYILVLDLSAICELEALFSTPDRAVPFPEIMANVMRLSYRHIRGFVWAALRRNHPKVSLLEAGKLIEDAGGVDALFAIIQAVGTTTQPDAEEQETRP